MSPTYGCIVYQEQVMQIVRDLGGYTMGRSDLVLPCDEQEKAVCHGKRTGEFRLRQSRRGRARLCGPGHSGKGRSGNLRGNDGFCKIRVQQVPRCMLRGCRLPDGLPEILLSGGIYGVPNDFCNR
ncbi:MAG: hypothetical protein ACLURV_06645 [Gallintestinimicrobium sp.]